MRRLILILAIGICSVAASQSFEDSAAVRFDHDSFMVYSFGSETPISKKEELMFRGFGGFELFDTIKYNSSDTAIINNLDSRIKSYIDSCVNKHKYPCDNIRELFYQYDRQFFFFSVNGHPYVMVNYVFQSFDWMHVTYRPCFIHDGQYFYWRITLDLESNELIKFNINGKG